MTGRVAILTDGLPTVTATLSEFFAENEFASEDLQGLFEAWSEGRVLVLGGGAEPLFAVKLYELGDERRTLRDVLEFAPQCYGLVP